MRLRHVTKSQQFSRADLEQLFHISDVMGVIIKRGGVVDRLQGCAMSIMFYQPSTRTRMSFAHAMHHLGGYVVETENAGEFSSAVKGESLEDTIRTIASYAERHVVVLRHPDPESAETAAALDLVPIINAGAGPGQHPTQAILDVYTLQKELGQVDGLTIALAGDLANGRAVRSFAYLLTKFDIKRLYGVAPSVVGMKDDILQHFRECGVKYEETDNLYDVAHLADAIYQTRVQKEWFQDRAREYAQACGKIVINREILHRMQSHAIVMHPLPIDSQDGKEIDPAVYDDRRIACFRQARNGIPTRMAILQQILAPES